MDKSVFKHNTQVKVRTYEVDWQGIVHNATYLLYFEVGRVEYLKRLGASMALNLVRGEWDVVLVRNEIDYETPAQFDDLLNVYTRISTMKNSSFVMEGLLERAESGERIATNIAHHVRVDPLTNRPIMIGDDFRKMVQEFEGSDCHIVWPTYNV